MSSDWTETQFKDLLAEPVRNGLYKPKQFHGDGVKIINMGELFAYPRLGAVEMRRLQVTNDELERFLVVPGDLLFARRSVVAEGAGKCALVTKTPEPTVFESSLIRARPDPAKAVSEYLYYFFSSSSGHRSLQSILRQVAVSGITGSDLGKLPVPLPKLDEQRRIVGVLTAFDHKIESNRSAEERLQKLGHAWFRRAAYGQPTGRMGDNVERVQSRVGDATVAVLSAVSSGELRESADVFSKRVHSADVSRYLLVPQWAFAYNPSRANIGSIGLNHRQILGAVSPAYVVAQASSETAWWLAESLRTSTVREQIERLSSGSVRQTLSFEDFASIELPAPRDQALTSFNATYVAIRQSLEALEHESETLVRLRNALLPKLISGQIRVPESYEADDLLGTAAELAPAK
jgi:type I restriction enzyme S subunit